MKVLKWFSGEGDDEHLCVGTADSAQTGEPSSDYRNEKRNPAGRAWSEFVLEMEGGFYVTGPCSSEKDFVGFGPFFNIKKCTEKPTESPHE